METGGKKLGTFLKTNVSIERISNQNGQNGIFAYVTENEHVLGKILRFTF